MMVCILINMICVFIVTYEDRRELFLTVGDAISSFLQRQDPTSLNWCMLSRPANNTTAHSTALDPKKDTGDYRWHSSLPKKAAIKVLPLPPPLCPESPSRGDSTWSKATSSGIWVLTLLMLVAYIATTMIISQDPSEGEGRGNVRLTYSMWQIKGFGTVQTNNLLANLAPSFVGTELLANTPQLLVSFLYYLLNDHLTRMLIAVEYNSFSLRHKPLRVSSPRGQQRSTFYLAIPYRYSVPLLLAFVLIHWFVSEGVFYVEIVPYDVFGNAIPSESIITCAISVIPLQVAMYLTIILTCVVIWMSRKKFQGTHNASRPQLQRCNQRSLSPATG